MAKLFSRTKKIWSYLLIFATIHGLEINKNVELLKNQEERRTSCKKTGRENRKSEAVYQNC